VEAIATTSLSSSLTGIEFVHLRRSDEKKIISPIHGLLLIHKFTHALYELGVTAATLSRTIYSLAVLVSG